MRNPRKIEPSEKLSTWSFRVNRSHDLNDTLNPLIEPEYRDREISVKESTIEKGVQWVKCCDINRHGDIKQ
jgi:hypothetical protein